jgi:hypothetical protein
VEGACWRALTLGFRPGRRALALRKFYAELTKEVVGVPGRGSSAPTNEKPITSPKPESDSVNAVEPPAPPKSTKQPRTLTLQQRHEAWDNLRQEREWP